MLIPQRQLRFPHHSMTHRRRRRRRRVQGLCLGRIIDRGEEWRTFSADDGKEDRSRVGSVGNALLSVRDSVCSCCRCCRCCRRCRCGAAGCAVVWYPRCDMLIGSAGWWHVHDHGQDQRQWQWRGRFEHARWQDRPVQLGQAPGVHSRKSSPPHAHADFMPAATARSLSDHACRCR